MTASEHLSPDQFVAGGYSIHVREEQQTHWGLPALHVTTQHAGRTVGGLSVHQRTYDEADTPVAHPNVWVSPDHQRKGVATAMYAQVGARWPKVPIHHSEHASEDAKALNLTLAWRNRP